MPARTLKILIVDDEAAMRMVIEMRLQGWGYEVLVASDGEQGLRMAETLKPDIILSDVVMPELNGMELLRAVRKSESAPEVVLITAQGTIDMAVEAMKYGALDFITKPIDYGKLQAILDAAAEDITLRQQSRQLSATLKKSTGFGPFIGQSRPMREIYDLVETLAASDASALITGESGTGKELVAHAIHDGSSRAKGPFIAVNSAAIPETLMESEIFGHEKGAFTRATTARAGCFELAQGGTLFLDEISEMPVHLQPKLLRVLEDRRVRRLGGSKEIVCDVRMLAATNRDPLAAIADGKLREDLYYRLNVFTVSLPPFRDRKEDIPSLVHHFLQQMNAKHGTSVIALRPEAARLMEAYGWPGNIRELRNVLERAVILTKGEWIEPSHLPPFLRAKRTSSGHKLGLPTGATAAATERELILKTLEETGNNKSETARRLGLDVKTIRNKLKSYGHG